MTFFQDGRPRYRCDYLQHASFTTKRRGAYISLFTAASTLLTTKMGQLPTRRDTRSSIVLQELSSRLEHPVMYSRRCAQHSCPPTRGPRTAVIIGSSNLARAGNVHSRKGAVWDAHTSLHAIGTPARRETSDRSISWCLFLFKKRVRLLGGSPFKLLTGPERELSDDGGGWQT